MREILFEGQSIDQVLEMTVDDAIAFFETNNQSKLAKKLNPLQQVGLGYVTLGQSSATLSGGEAQRIKLASFIGKGLPAIKSSLFLMNLLPVYTFTTLKNY